MAVLQVHEEWPMGHHAIDSGKRNVELDRCPGTGEQLVCGRVDGAGHDAAMAIPSTPAEIKNAGVDAHLIGIAVGLPPHSGASAAIALDSVRISCSLATGR